MLAALAITLALGNVVTLDATTESLRLTTSSTSSTDVTVSWADHASGTITPGSTQSNITTVTTTTIAAAPAASTQRAIASVTACNVGTAAQTLTLKHDTSGTERRLAYASVAPNECAIWDNAAVPRRLTAAGVLRTQGDAPGFTGRFYGLAKVATATDAAGYAVSLLAATGFPGAWSPGTPGLNGVVTACDVVGTAGSGGALSIGTHVLPDPASGGWYLTRFGVVSPVASTYELADVLWYGTGIAVTTTTAQAITTPTWPARDINGSTNGDGLRIGLLTTTANTNAAVIANTTVSYTNSEGTAGRTATFSGAVGFQAPATPVINTWMPFSLAAGDTGVRSIQSVTLGTSYGAGALSLVVYRPLAQDGVPLANVGSGSLQTRQPLNPGVRVWNDSCLAVHTIGSTATTAPSVFGGGWELMER